MIPVALAAQRHRVSLTKMVEKIAERAEAWVARWSRVLFPSSALTAKECSAGEFFLGNLALTYAATIAVSLTYVLVSYRHVVARHAQGDAGESLAYASKLFVGYAIVMFLALLVVAGLSFLIYRALGSRASFLRHWNAWIDLLAFEPLAGLSIGLIWISDFTGLSTDIALVLFALTRLGQLAKAYSLLRSTHTLRRPKHVLAFTTGIVPAFLVFSVVGVSLGFVIVGTVVVMWWD
jgi:hypothetical protein